MRFPKLEKLTVLAPVVATVPELLPVMLQVLAAAGPTSVFVTVRPPSMSVIPVKVPPIGVAAEPVTVSVPRFTVSAVL